MRTLEIIEYNGKKYFRMHETEHYSLVSADGKTKLFSITNSDITPAVPPKFKKVRL